MATCFIFTEHLQDDGCLITRFDNEGKPDLEAKHYSFAEIQTLQEGYKTIIVCSSDLVNFADLDLPWLAERKARIAIPFALEDRLPQPIELLHFAFDKQHYRNGHYEIVIIEKQYIRDLMNQLIAEDIEFDSITLDWYALKENEAIFIGETAIINSVEYKGALSKELAAVFHNVFHSCTNYVFQDSVEIVELPNKTILTEPSFMWISQRLLDVKPMNLSQGEMHHGTAALQIKKGYQYLAGLATFWLILLIGANAYKLHIVNKQLTQVNQEIAVIYKQFFPDAKQIINPKFRINQLLGNSLNNAQSTFFSIIDKLSKGIKDSNVTLEQFRYLNKILLITISSPDFATLEKFENSLKQQQLTVNQTQAANRDQQVVATLELK